MLFLFLEMLTTQLELVHRLRTVKLYFHSLILHGVVLNKVQEQLYLVVGS
jgi:hypothetical protein